MKNFICAVMATVLLLTLVACGGPDVSTPDVNNSTADPLAIAEEEFNSAIQSLVDMRTSLQERIPEAEELLETVTVDDVDDPSAWESLRDTRILAIVMLDEPIPDMGSDAEEIQRQVQDISEQTDTIQGILYDLENAIEQVTESRREIHVPVSTDGIVAFKISYGTVYNYKSTGKFMYQAFTAELDSIDPETGTVTHLRTFSSEDTHSCSAALNGVGDNRRRMLMNFSADLSKMTAKLTLEDGSEHVGWIDENGNFTDVSKMVTSDIGDFGALTKHDNPCFGPDNYFYFMDLTNAETKWGGVPQSAQIKRVPMDDLTISAVETIVEDDRSPNYGFYFLPDGSVEINGLYGSWDYYDESMTYPAHCGGLNDHLADWISENEIVGVKMIEQANVIYMIYKYTLSGVKDSDKWFSERTPLVPNVAGRTNWNPILSPDKSQVAFLSRLTTGTDASSYLYIVPVDGGDPVKVSTDYTFITANNNLYTYLLTWNSAD